MGFRAKCVFMLAVGLFSALPAHGAIDRTKALALCARVAELRAAAGSPVVPLSATLFKVAEAHAEFLVSNRTEDPACLVRLSWPAPRKEDPWKRGCCIPKAGAPTSSDLLCITNKADEFGLPYSCKDCFSDPFAHAYLNNVPSSNVLIDDAIDAWNQTTDYNNIVRGNYKAMACGVGTTNGLVVYMGTEPDPDQCDVAATYAADKDCPAYRNCTSTPETFCSGINRNPCGVETNAPNVCGSCKAGFKSPDASTVFFSNSKCFDPDSLVLGDDGWTDGEIAGVVVGSVIGIPLLGVGLFFLYKLYTTSHKTRSVKHTLAKEEHASGLGQISLSQKNVTVTGPKSPGGVASQLSFIPDSSGSTVKGSVRPAGQQA